MQFSSRANEIVIKLIIRLLIITRIARWRYRSSHSLARNFHYAIVVIECRASQTSLNYSFLRSSPVIVNHSYSLLSIIPFRVYPLEPSTNELTHSVFRQITWAGSFDAGMYLKGGYPVPKLASFNVSASSRSAAP